jgi:hypothetical protein
MGLDIGADWLETDPEIQRQAAALARCFQAATNCSDNARQEFERELINFAETIKREAIEP